MVSIRPPDYFPRGAYFALMLAAERFVIADTFQYSRQSFQNRSRIRTPQGWQWMSIPIEGGQHGLPINEVRIDNRSNWRGKHWRALEFNYRSTAYFEFYEDDLAGLFDEQWDSLGACTSASVRLVQHLLHLPAEVTQSSILSGRPASLSTIMSHYSGETLLVPAESAPHDGREIEKVQVIRYEEEPYRQNFDGFVGGLSVLDLLFNYGPAAVQFLQEGVERGRNVR